MSIGLTTTLSYSQTKKKKYKDESEKLDCAKKRLNQFAAAIGQLSL